MTTQNDKERLLSILHAHGQRFLEGVFDVPAAPKQETHGEEEWTGFGSPARGHTSEIASDSERDSGV